MRIVVLSDIHANAHALDAVMREVEACRPDHVVVAGDIINRGPSPREVLDRMLECREKLGWLLLRGNHEDYVLKVGRDEDPHSPLFPVFGHTRWTHGQLQDHLATLAALPHQLTLFDRHEGELRFVHASMRSNRHGLYEDMPEQEIGELVAPPPRVLAVGHTHIPFVRRVGGALVVNAGAVGMPFDGDPRASFAVLELIDGHWHAHVMRVHYDRAPVERAYRTTGYLDDGGPMTRLILEEFRAARPRLGLWHRAYEDRVARGELAIDASVDALLAETKRR